jgi:ATP-binding protein involved in chromosome partitioning
MKTLTNDAVLDALKVIQDPDLHKNIVSLGFVKNIVITGADVALTIELTTPACPVKDELKTQAETVLRTLTTGTVSVTMTSNVASRQAVPTPKVLYGVRNTIAVASGKGGVGKSTVAVNLAVALAMEGARVGLIDCDIYGPSIPMMMNITDKPKLRGQHLEPLEKFGVKVMSIGFLVDPSQAVIWRGPMASGAVKQFISDVYWGELDYLIFDLPPGTGDIQLTLVQQIPLTGAVIVTTPQEISLADARKGMAMFQKVNVPLLGLIENMSYFVCSHCGERENIFDAGGGRRAAKEMNIPFLGEIPIDTKLRIGGDIGRPLVESDPWSPQAQVILGIARQLAAQISITNLTQSSTPDMEISLNS